MKNELGKWLMDIAKYLTTAVILTSILGDIQNKIVLYSVTFVAVICSLGWGLWLVRDNNKKQDKEE